MEIYGVDLFCGIGGLTHGLISAGIDIKLGIDLDETCRYVYQANNNSDFINLDIKDVTGNLLEPYFEESDIKVLTGCAPCQPFSSYSRTASVEKRLEKWFLLDEFTRIVSELNPDIVSMENVPELIKKDVFKNFVNTLETLGYNVIFKNLYCPNFGIPQNRTRLVLLASKLGEIKLPTETHSKENYVTVRESIYGLPSLGPGEINQDDIVHQTSRLSDTNFLRIKQSIPGGTWSDWEEHLIADCHKKETGRTYSGVYGRMVWDKIAPTITTQFIGFGNGRFGHPEQDRALSLREGAILQSFPRNYIFVEPGEDIIKKNLARHIGNAVPVRLGEVIGIAIREHIEEVENGEVII